MTTYSLMHISSGSNVQRSVYDEQKQMNKNEEDMALSLKDHQ